MEIGPLGAIAAIITLGITVEAVEAKSKNAAYVLVLVLLLGIITFNAAEFNRQTRLIYAWFNAKPARANPSAEVKAKAKGQYR